MVGSFLFLDFLPPPEAIAASVLDTVLSPSSFPLEELVLLDLFIFILRLGDSGRGC